MERDDTEQLQRYLTGLTGKDEATNERDQLDALARNHVLQRMAKLTPESGETSPISKPSSGNSPWPEGLALPLIKIIDQYPELLWETALLTTRRERSLPWPVFPGIFDQLDQVKNKAEQSLYERALGPLGRWVCSMHPDYYVFGSLDDSWKEGDTIERLAWMRQMRMIHPNRARKQMQHWLNEERADLRHLILDAIAFDPEESDLDLLRTCVDDRSKKIRARALLLRLQLEDNRLRDGVTSFIHLKTEGLARLETDPEQMAVFLEKNGLSFGGRQSPDLFVLCRNISPKWWIHSSWKACTDAIQHHKKGDRLMASLAWSGMHHGMDSMVVSTIQQLLMRCDASVIPPFAEKTFIELLSPKVFKTLCERWLKREQEMAEHPLLLDWLMEARLFWSDEMTRLFIYRFKNMIEQNMLRSIEDFPVKQWLQAVALHSNPGLTREIRRMLDDTFIPFTVASQVQEMYDMLETRQRLRGIFAKLDKHS